MSAQVRAYVGTYSSPQGPEGSKGNGKGIYLYPVDSSTGLLGLQPELFEDELNPSWLAMHPAGTFLYAANEVFDFGGAASGAVTAYAVDRVSGALTRLNRVSSQGSGPAHLSVHPSGKFVFVANYYGGTFAVLPVRANGQIGEASDVKRDVGGTGPTRASTAPPGSFAMSGHDRTHAHMIEADPTGKFVLGTDLGTDEIHVWRLNAPQGALEEIGLTPVKVPPGDGPRHFVFHPNGKWMYLLQEEASTLILFDWDSDKGSLKKRQQLSTLPEGFKGTNFTSEVRISPDGRFVYAANRLHDSIAWFAIAKDGTLSLRGETWTRGDYPRSFSLDVSGRFLYCCNQRSDAVTTFLVNRKTGALQFSGQYTAVGTPSIVILQNS